MNFPRPAEKSRPILLRIVFYLVLILIAAWWMTKWDKSRQNRTIPVEPPPSSEEILSAAGTDSELPLMVVIALADESIRQVVAEAQQRHASRCRIVLLTTGTDTDGIQRVFQVEALPAALLYNKDNKEVARKSGPITAELLDSLAEL